MNRLPPPGSPVTVLLFGTMRKPLILFLGAAVLQIAVGLAYAQHPLILDDGARVRVSAPYLPAQLYGQIRADDVQAGVLTILTADGDARVSLPLASVSRVEVSRGRSRQKTAGIAAGIGLLAGGIIGASLEDDASIGSGLPAAALAGAGGVIGGLVGFAYAPERWRTVHEELPAKANYQVFLRSGARIKQLGNGNVAVRGERNRRAGMARGALILGGLVALFGGIDYAQGDLSGREYVGGTSPRHARCGTPPWAVPS